MTKRMERGRLQSRPRSAVFGAVALIAAVLVAGCGDDGGSTDSEAKADFIAQADQICADAGQKINAETVKRQNGREGQTGRFVIDLYKEVTIPTLDDAFAQIGKLTPPPGDEEQVQEILAQRRDGALGRQIAAIDMIDPAHLAVGGHEAGDDFVLAAIHVITAIPCREMDSSAAAVRML